jgi:hypothetical protein
MAWGLASKDEAWESIVKLGYKFGEIDQKKQTEAAKKPLPDVGGILNWLLGELKGVQNTTFVKLWKEFIEAGLSTSTKWKSADVGLYNKYLLPNQKFILNDLP